MEISKEELRLIRYHGGLSGCIWQLNIETKEGMKLTTQVSLNFSKLIATLKEERKILQTLEQKIENHLFPQED